MGLYHHDGTYYPTANEIRKEEKEQKIKKLLDSGKWKHGILNGHKTIYLVSKNGDILNMNTLRLVNGTINSGGYRTSILWYYDSDGSMKCANTRHHRFIAETWIPNPENKPEVDHINRNRINNRVENLRWVTSSENNTNTNRSRFLYRPAIGLKVEEIKTCMRSILCDTSMTTERIVDIYNVHEFFAKKLINLTQYLDSEGLIAMDGTVDFLWRPINLSTYGATADKYRISPYGLIINDRGFVYTGHLSNDGYNKISIAISTSSENKNHLHIAVGRLVALTFIPNPENKPQICHLDGIKINEWISNLQWATGKENVRHSFENGTSNTHPGSSNGNSRYMEDQIKKACELMSVPYPPVYIEEKTGVSRITQMNIRQGKLWTYIASKYTFPKGRWTNSGKFIKPDGSVIDTGRRIVVPHNRMYRYTMNDVKKVCILLENSNMTLINIAAQTNLPRQAISDIQKIWLLRHELKNAGINVPNKNALSSTVSTRKTITGAYDKQKISIAIQMLLDGKSNFDTVQSTGIDADVMKQLRKACFID